VLDGGKKIEQLDQQLMAVSARLVEPLRVRRELGELFGQLEREG